VTSSATPWRQIINIRNLEFCGALKTTASFPLVRDTIDFAKKLIPTMMTECPRKLPYRFEALKINYTEVDDDGTVLLKVPLANGIYRIVLHFSNENDTEGFRIEWQSEVKYMRNLDVFN
jgi:hypothetical protein